jgi:hypothetical protein
LKFFIYLTLTFGLLLTGCLKTEGILKIKGKVVDESSKEKIPWRDIIVQGLVDSSNKLVPINAGQFSTDSTGYFTYSLRKVKNAYYYNFCFVGDSDYAFMAKEIALIDLKKNAQYLSFSLSKLVDFTIKIYRKSQTPACDTLCLSWKSNGVDERTLYPYKIDNYGLKSDNQLYWIGGNVKSTIKTKAFADKSTVVRWVLFRNGKLKEIIDTITCRRYLLNNVYLKY